MPSDPFSALTFVTGPAILTNACAILQNGVTIRYNLAITQWREFRAAVAGGDDRLGLLFVDPDLALELAERRIRLQLLALGLLNAAIALFGAATIGGLAGAFAVQTLSAPAGWVSLFMVVTGAAALAVMSGAILTLFREGDCGRSMVRLHHPVGDRSSRRNAGTSAS